MQPGRGRGGANDDVVLPDFPPPPAADRDDDVHCPGADQLLAFADVMDDGDFDYDPGEEDGDEGARPDAAGHGEIFSFWCFR